MLFLVCGDLPLGSDPAMTGARLVLSCLRILDRRKVEDPVAENKREIHALETRYGPIPARGMRRQTGLVEHSFYRSAAC